MLGEIWAFFMPFFGITYFDGGRYLSWQLSAAFAAMKASFAGLSAVLAANPIFLIVAAVAAAVAAVVLLYNKCEWFRDAVNAV